MYRTVSDVTFGLNQVLVAAQAKVRVNQGFDGQERSKTPYKLSTALVTWRIVIKSQIT